MQKNVSEREDFVCFFEDTDTYKCIYGQNWNKELEDDYDEKNETGLEVKK